MPFISKDWRSPGEEWVKTQEGWEKKKVLECTAQRYPVLKNFNSTDNNEQKSWSQEGDDSEKTNDSVNRVPPHCHITIKCTREIAGFNGLSEAVRRLDFASAVRDARRVHYTCALLALLQPRLPRLPAAAQRLLLAALEQLADQVASSQQNPRRLRLLAAALAAAAAEERGACWGRPLGARALWRRHAPAVQRICDVARRLHGHEPDPEVEPKLHDLPEECIREILLRLSDHEDLDAAGGAWRVMQALCGEQRVWRDLVRFHFTPQQIDAACTDDWKATFHQLRKLHGLREDAQYAETLSLCRHCRCLFWRSLGHPCIADQCSEYRARLERAGGPLAPRPVPPAAFLEFFSL